jgi:hypothetical protein
MKWTMTDWHEHFRLHREMTAGDLGLPLGQWPSEWLRSTYGRRPIALRDWLERQPDAPYAFWLGEFQSHDYWDAMERRVLAREKMRLWDAS